MGEAEWRRASAKHIHLRGDVRTDDPPRVVSNRSARTRGLDDPWVYLDGVDGWEAFRFAVLIELYDGLPRMIGLRMEPAPGEHDPDDIILGSRRMASLPVGRLAKLAASMRANGPHGFMQAASHPDEPLVRPRGGSDEFSEQVADVYLRARAEGSAGQRAVQRFFGVPRQTAEGWIKEARQRSALPPSARMRDLIERGQE
jgi:hypothetical protein